MTGQNRNAGALRKGTVSDCSTRRTPWSGCPRRFFGRSRWRSAGRPLWRPPAVSNSGSASGRRPLGRRRAAGGGVSPDPAPRNGRRDCSYNAGCRPSGARNRPLRSRRGHVGAPRRRTPVRRGCGRSGSDSADPCSRCSRRHPGSRGTRKGVLGEVDEVYRTDAYHSLSIEGYQVSPELD